jgi:F-type H+-transporting ATPase subunit delta
MMREDLVAERYAHALFLVAERAGTIFDALDALRELQARAGADPRVVAYFRSPLVPLGRKRAVARDGLTADLPPLVGRFADLLLRKKRLVLFPAIVAAYEAQVRRWQGLQEAEAVSAVPLTAEETKRLHAKLERVTGKTIELKTRVDPDLIGGLYVRIGDRVLDRSVKGLLHSLEERLLAVDLP